MKRLLFLFVLTLTLIASGSAQLVSVDFDITRNNYITNAETVAVASIPLVYAGSTYPTLKGCRPDSMRLEWRSTATGDSIAADVATRVNFAGSGYTAYATKDSIKAAELDLWLFPRSTYSTADELGVKITARAAGNSLTGANKLWLHVRQWFTLPSARR